MVEGISTRLKAFVDGKRCSAENLKKYEKSETNESSDENEIENNQENIEVKVKMGTKIDDKYLVVLAEPSTILSVACTVDAKGRIFRVDDGMALLLGYISMRELLGIEISKLIPAIQLEANSEVQHVCAQCIRGNSIPVIVKVNTEKDSKTQRPLMYELEIQAFSTVTGVVILTESGALHSFNENFIEALIGKKQKEALKDMTHITDIIPKFHYHILTSPLNGTYNEVVVKLSDEFFDHFTNKKDLISSHKHPSVTWLINDLTLSVHKLNGIESVVNINSSHPSISYVDEMCSSIPSTSSQFIENVQLCDNLQQWNELINDRTNQSEPIIEGSFYGFAKHSDSNLIAICFNIKRLEPNNGASWAVCINYNKTIDFGFFGQMNEEGLMSGSICDNENIHACNDNNDNYRVDFKIEKNSMITVEKDDENAQAIAGEYSKYYNTQHLIGNGAFGSVKLTARKDTGILAVAKFICKSKVFSESWIPSPKRGNRVVPIELHLLETLSHPNIVKLLDVFENDLYYQLVMEKLGCGMDLFEFIEQQPKLDEPLISYIFRQVVNAVAYLHSKNIVHRDLKDENVIIDQNFSCKLIDFGSAAYFGHNFVFSTFCGTMEYCSPEVLRGNKYRGPELEMWSLGILLYTLVFFENPFRSLQETIRAEIKLPWEVSEDLFQVIAWLLQRDPQFRATVRDISNHCWVKQSIDLRMYKFQDVLQKCVFMR
uniref:Protein kinase domain-containing protein n=3 Tax=Wuchereria bancrofti TaxID=6293 RepID=A0AAF5PLR4_WUCBA